jgi:uncharacterized protein (DUF1778 family)
MKKPETATDTLHIRVKPSDKRAWKKQAKAEGKTLAQYVIDRLGRAK